jgi:Sir2 family
VELFPRTHRYHCIANIWSLLRILSESFFPAVHPHHVFMSSSERDPDVPRDGTSNGVICNEKNGDDGLESLEAQFQNKVHVSTTTTVDDDDDAKIIKTPASATENSVKVPDEAKNIVVAGDEQVEQFPSDGESVKPIPSNITNKSLQRIATLIQEAKNILVLSGAGVSVAAGIPDFRTPGTGLYDNLQKYNLPYAEAVFDIQYYQVNPHPFIKLASELWPQHHRPTITHTFIALLADKQRLLRNYTQVRVQNIICFLDFPFSNTLSWNISWLLIEYRWVRTSGWRARAIGSRVSWPFSVRKMHSM